MAKKELGKISHAFFGIGGYQDAMLGLHLTFEGEWGGVCTDQCWWDYELIECSKHAQWTEEDRSDYMIEILKLVSKTLKDAKCKNVSQLVGTPVEITFAGEGGCGSTIESWRILTEVL